MTSTSAQRKVSRGIEHIKRLRDETSAFVEKDGYVFRTDHERRSPSEVVYRSIAIERVPIPDEWALLAGEAVQNLRSGLDHAVWSAWKSIPGNSGDGRHTEFPIYTDPDRFRENAPRKL